jgi:hypothetical protein
MDSTVPVHARPGTMIGAWGFHVFESDHDLYVVALLSQDTGVDVLNDSLLNPSDAVKVRKCFEEGALDRVFGQYHRMLKNYTLVDIKQAKSSRWQLELPRYYIFLLGLLAMQLGCPLSRRHRCRMRANWNGCLFMYERLDQAKMAA